MGHLKSWKLRVRWNIVCSCGAFLDEGMEWLQEEDCYARYKQYSSCLFLSYFFFFTIELYCDVDVFVNYIVIKLV